MPATAAHSTPDAELQARLLTVAMLAPFFKGWRGDSPEPALPAPKPAKPAPAAARALELA